MFSNLSLGRVPIEVQINLAQRDSFYTNQSCVSGDIVLDAKCSVNITTIVVTLSGAAISRLGSQGSSEIHQVQAYILRQSTKCLTCIFSSSKGRRGSFLQRFCPKSAPDLMWRLAEGGISFHFQPRYLVIKSNFCSIRYWMLIYPKFSFQTLQSATGRLLVERERIQYILQLGKESWRAFTYWDHYPLQLAKRDRMRKSSIF